MVVPVLRPVLVAVLSFISVSPTSPSAVMCLFGISDNDGERAEDVSSCVGSPTIGSEGRGEDINGGISVGAVSDADVGRGENKDDSSFASGLVLPIEANKDEASEVAL